jgi:hypothetical protein
LWQTGRRTFFKKPFSFPGFHKLNCFRPVNGTPPPSTGFFWGIPSAAGDKKANPRLAISSLSPSAKFPVVKNSAMSSFGAGFITHLSSPLAPFVAHLNVKGVGSAVENPPCFMQGTVFDYALLSPEGRMADAFVFLACHSVPPFRCVAGAGNTLSRCKTRKTKSPGWPGLPE